MVTEVDYRNSRKHDMKSIIAKAHSVGATVVWDMAHSIGALPIDVTDTNTDFAVGCTYKYLNGGPGSPAFIYVAPRLLNTVEPALSGWFAHEAPFAFDLNFRPTPSKIDRMRIGTQSMAAFTLLETALDIWDEVNLDDVRSKSIELSEFFISEVLTIRKNIRVKTINFIIVLSLVFLLPADKKIFLKYQSLSHKRLLV